MSVVDMSNRRKILKTNLVDYLENTVAQRLEHGIVEKEKLLWELAQEKAKETDKGDEKASAFSAEEASELEELLKNIIGNKV
jgi:hypothetical protein